MCRMTWGWVLVRRSWFLWSEIRGHVNVMDGHLTIGCAMHHGVMDWHLQEGAISRKGCAPALQVRGTVMWPGQATTMSFYHALFLQVPAGWSGHIWRTPHCQHPYLCFILGDERRQLVVSQIRKWHVLASHRNPCAFQVQLWTPEEGFWDSSVSVSHSVPHM